MTWPTVIGWAVALAAGAGVWLLVPSGVRERPSTGSHLASGRVVAAAGAALAGGLVVVAEGQALALGLIALGVVAGTTRLVRTGRARRDADRRADRVVELCEALADELRAGQPPARAVGHAAEGWPELASVAASAALGGDVPAALRRLSGAPGARGLRDVASAWEVSAESGATMARALARTADTARLRRTTQRLVSSELASAQATARLVAALPFGLLLVGSGAGGDPWAFLVGTPVGLAGLALGLALAFVGLWWIERIAASVVEG